MSELYSPRSSGAHQLLEVGPQRRLAAREAELQHAEGARLPEDAAPFLGGELAFEARARERERVGAIRALQRTLVGQLGEQPQRFSVHRAPVPSRRARRGTP